MAVNIYSGNIFRRTFYLIITKIKKKANITTDNFPLPQQQQKCQNTP